MTRRALRVRVLLLAMLMCSGGCGPEPARAPAAAGTTVAAPAPSGTGSTSGSNGPPAPGSPARGDDEPPGTCGSEVCELEQFCEDLYKGHALDARGRPLQRQKCMPLPDACKARPTCACVTKVVASTHCREDGGRVYLDDHPNRQ